MPYKTTSLLVAALLASLVSTLLVSFPRDLWAITNDLVFATKRALGIGIPYAHVIRSPIDSLPVPPYYEHWDPTRHRAIFEQIRGAGFDTIRFVIDPIPLLITTEPQRQEIYNNFDTAISDILSLNLNIIVDMHVNVPDKDWNHKTLTVSLTDSRFRSYTEMIGSVSRFLSYYDPRRVALELFNEPPPPCHWTGRPEWSEFQKELFREARRAAPGHTLILTGPCWGSIEGLEQLNPRDYDANTLFTFHTYEPFVFTHQGVFWGQNSVRYIHRLPYPPIGDRSAEFIAATEREINLVPSLDAATKTRLIANNSRLLKEYFQKPMDRNWLKEQLAPALRWADKNQIPHGRLWVGEFGAMRDAYGFKAATTEDRIRWLADMRTLFEQAGLSWSIWSYAGGMGINIGDKIGPLDARFLEPLGLRHD